jgi:hypothetical protein
MHQKQQAIVLAASPGERARVVGLTAAAAHAGIRKGITVHQARALGSERLKDRLEVVVRSQADTEAAQAALADVGLALRARGSRTGRVFFEVGDLMQLYSEGEAEIMRARGLACARWAFPYGGSGRVKGIARAASRAVARGSCARPEAPAAAAAFLAPLPLNVGLAALTNQGDEDTADAVAIQQVAELTNDLKLGSAYVGRLGGVAFARRGVALGERARVCGVWRPAGR